MLQQGKFVDETKSTLQAILEIMRAHNEEVKLFNEQLRKDYNQQETGNNEQGNGRVVDDVCQSKEGLEEIRGENLGDLILSLKLKRVLGMLREDKGREPAELIKKSLEDLLEIDRVYKMFSDGTRDSRIFRETEIRIGKKQTRKGVT